MEADALGGFFGAFGQTFLGVSQVGIVILGAGLLVARGVLRPDVVKGLSDVSVLVFLPCLIFSNITETLNPAAQPTWWAVPLTALAMVSVGILLAWVTFRRELPGKRDLIPLASMQNAGFLILPLGQVLVPDQFDRFALYTFLYILAFNPVLWSIGKALSTGRDDRTFAWIDLITPPLVANLLALTMVFTGARALLPSPVTQAVKLVGSATVPVATFILGASLGGMAHRYREHLADGARALTLKLVAMPALTVLALSATTLRRTDPVLALMLVLQGASAPAINIVVQIQTYGGNLERTGTIMLLGYIGALFTIPVWVAVWQMLG